MSYSVRETTFMSSESFLQPAASNQTEVFAVQGADPEVLAFAMAKYSRSALSMRESLNEISSQKASQFLNTFYFQYGHRSIADLAHIAFAIERLSLLAAIVLVDETRWDGQERSTRYQNFLKSGWYLPDFGENSASAALYSKTVESLFAAYQHTTEAVLSLLRDRISRPESLKQDAYERTLRARAFDVARYLLPLATNTSLGQIVSARTLETQVARLLSHPAAEIRLLGEKLREASTAPTLVKYAQPNPYLIQTQAELAQTAAQILAPLSSKTPLHAMPVVDLVERTETLEVELAATLLYSASHDSYRQIRDLVSGLPAAQVSEIVELGFRHRGRHDEALRVFQAGAALRFDILMDIGGFRDMHRHRRCTQIIQGFTSQHGYETPGAADLAAGTDILVEASIDTDFRSAIESAHAAAARIASGLAPEPATQSCHPDERSQEGSAVASSRRRERPGAENPQAALKGHDFSRAENAQNRIGALAPEGSSEAAQSALYLLPLATRIRSLFKMDFAEAQYITELRSGPAGHFSYRRVAWEMFLALERQHPTLAKHIRVTDFTKPIDILQR
jgi:thymidylate synthase ThyX